ncbi:hypothetical protein D3C75_1007140 [compost metagenome]
MRDANRAAIAHDDSYCRLGDELYALGRYGQKTGRGFYQYEGRERHNDYEVVALAERLAGELHVTRRPVDDDPDRQQEAQDHHDQGGCPGEARRHGRPMLDGPLHPVDHDHQEDGHGQGRQDVP